MTTLRGILKNLFLALQHDTNICIIAHCKEILQRGNVQQFSYVVKLGNMFTKEVQAVR